MSVLRVPVNGEAAPPSDDEVSVRVSYNFVWDEGAGEAGQWVPSPVSAESGLPEGAATEATLAAISGKLPSSLGAKTGAASLSVVPATDAGMATGAKQDTGNTSLSSIDGKIPTVGQKAMAASSPVVLASDQTVPTVPGITGIGDGRKVVASAATAVALVASSTPCKRITICAETDNTGTIVVGASTVIAALSTRRGIPLEAGDVYELDIDDVADVFIDSTVSGDGVTFAYFT